MRKWSMTRVSIWIASGLAILIAVALLANALMAWRTERRMQTILAAIRAAGDPASIGDLEPAPVADEEHAGVILKQLAPRLDAFAKDHARLAKSEDIAAKRAILNTYPDIAAGLAEAANRDVYASVADFSVGHTNFVNDNLI
jgi:hypothetical protein